MPVIPALWEAEAGGSPEVGSLRPAWLTWRNPVSSKKYKISWVWQQMPVIPATQEAETGESLEPGGRGCGELRSCHCILAWATRAGGRRGGRATLGGGKAGSFRKAERGRGGRLIPPFPGGGFRVRGPAAGSTPGPDPLSSPRTPKAQGVGLFQSGLFFFF